MTRRRWRTAALGAVLALTAIGAPVAAQEGIHLEEGAAGEHDCHALEVWDGDSLLTVLPGWFGLGYCYTIDQAKPRFLPNGRTLFEWSYGLWATDGTVDGTLVTGSTFRGDWGVLGRTGYAQGWSDLTMTRGTRASTLHIGRANLDGRGVSLGIPRYVKLGNRIYFTAPNHPFNDSSNIGYEIWVSDGTRKGTHILKDINPGPGGSRPVNLRIDGTKLRWSTTVDGHAGYWVSDGTRAGTHRSGA